MEEGILFLYSICRWATGFLRTYNVTSRNILDDDISYLGLGLGGTHVKVPRYLLYFSYFKTR